MVSLDEYAAARQRTYPCPVCEHPQRAILEDGHRRGHSFRLLLSWLKAEHAYPGERSAFEAHWRNGHVESGD